MQGIQRNAGDRGPVGGHLLKLGVVALSLSLLLACTAPAMAAPSVEPSLGFGVITERYGVPDCCPYVTEVEIRASVAPTRLNGSQAFTGFSSWKETRTGTAPNGCTAGPTIRQENPITSRTFVKVPFGGTSYSQGVSAVELAATGTEVRTSTHGCDSSAMFRQVDEITWTYNIPDSGKLSPGCYQPGFRSQGLMGNETGTVPIFGVGVHASDCLEPAPPPDGTAPETTINSGPEGTIETNAVTFDFSSSEAGSTFECELDGPGAATTSIDSFCASPKTYSSLANGSYRFSVRARDASYNTDATPASRSFIVAAPAGGSPPPALADTTRPPLSGLADMTKPRLSSLSLAPARFRAAGNGPSVAALRGSTVSYGLSEPATVAFRVERALPGRRVGGRCIRPARSNRRGRRCTRHVIARGTFAHEGDTGQNSFRFSGRMRGRKLTPGRYWLRAIATDAADNKSLLRRSRFRVTGAEAFRRG